MADVADMESTAQRQIFTALTTPMEGMSVAAATTYMQALVVNSDYSGYDWSGCSLFVDRTTATTPQPTTHSTPVTMISARHAICADHNKGHVGRTIYFRTPAGAVVSAVVEQDTEIAGSDLGLVRFATNPSAALKRYPICTDESLISYVLYYGRLWMLDQDMSNRMRISVTVQNFPALVYHAATISGWSNSNPIQSGSGRPAFVALDNGELIITGTLSSSIWNTRPSYMLTELNAAMAPYGESVTTLAIPSIAIPFPPVSDISPAHPIVSGITHGLTDYVGAEVALLMN